MNPYGAPVKNFLLHRGYKFKGSFSKFFGETSLLVYLKFRPIQNAFDSNEKPGFAISFQVFYPMQDAFIQISPDEVADLRRDGRMLRVNFTHEADGIFARTERDAVEAVLREWFDFWEAKIGDPEKAREIVAAFRGRAPFPPYLAYLQEFVAHDEHQKLEFQLERRPLIWPFDGGVNLLSNVAYLNAGGRFKEAQELISAALDESYFIGVRHARVVMDDFLKKLLADAQNEVVQLSEENVRALRELGLR